MRGAGADAAIYRQVKNYRVLTNVLGASSLSWRSKIQEGTSRSRASRQIYNEVSVIRFRAVVNVGGSASRLRFVRFIEAMTHLGGDICADIRQQVYLFRLRKRC